MTNAWQISSTILKNYPLQLICFADKLRKLKLSEFLHKFSASAVRKSELKAVTENAFWHTKVQLTE